MSGITKAEKRNWIAALKSGKYSQGHGALKMRYSGEKVFHCCLGVLAEELLKKNPDRMVTIKNNLETNEFLFADILDEDVQEDLATLNDNGTPFDKIAEVIQRNVVTKD